MKLPLCITVVLSLVGAGCTSAMQYNSRVMTAPHGGVQVSLPHVSHETELDIPDSELMLTSDQVPHAVMLDMNQEYWNMSDVTEESLLKTGVLLEVSHIDVEEATFRVSLASLNDKETLYYRYVAVRNALMSKSGFRLLLGGLVQSSSIQREEDLIIFSCVSLEDGVRYHHSLYLYYMEDVDLVLITSGRWPDDLHFAFDRKMRIMSESIRLSFL